MPTVTNKEENKLETIFQFTEDEIVEILTDWVIKKLNIDNPESFKIEGEINSTYAYIYGKIKVFKSSFETHSDEVIPCQTN
jgi:putative sterol carrier protein